MNDDKSVEFKLLRLEMQEDSLEVFPQENRIDITLSDQQLSMRSMAMGMEAMVSNVVLPIRNTLPLVQKS